jgi:hypothetical protein
MKVTVNIHLSGINILYVKKKKKRSIYLIIKIIIKIKKGNIFRIQIAWKQINRLE